MTVLVQPLPVRHCALRLSLKPTQRSEFEQAILAISPEQLTRDLRLCRAVGVYLLTFPKKNGAEVKGFSEYTSVHASLGRQSPGRVQVDAVVKRLKVLEETC